VTEIQELREIVQAQAKRLTDTRAVALLNERRDEQIHERIRKLENALADARRDHADLVKLVERMGRDLDVHYADRVAHGEGSLDGYLYTIIGQREYDAAMHEAEGAPPDAGMLESVQ